MAESQFFGRSCSPLARATGIAGVSGGPHTHPEMRSADFDLTGLEVRIARLVRTGRDRTLDQHNGLDAGAPRAAKDVRRRPARVEGHLNQPAPVAQIQKHDPAEIARSVHPAAKTHGLARVGSAQRAAHPGSEGCR